MQRYKAKVISPHNRRLRRDFIFNAESIDAARQLLVSKGWEVISCELSDNVKDNAILAASQQHGDTNDCTVRSLAAILSAINGDSEADAYKLAHKAFRIAGRVLRQGCRKDVQRRAFAMVGLKLGEWMPREERPGTSLTAERELPRGRYFLIYTKAHVAAFDGERIVDWTSGRRTRCVGICEVTKL